MSRWWPRSLAGQAIALQIVVIAIVVLAGSVLALLDARRDGDAAARQQVIGIATALADSPSTAEAIESGRATEVLQPATEAVRTNTDIAFITIMAPDRTRFTHTDPSQIGGRYIGTIEPALRGETFSEVFTGTLGPSIRAVAPVRGQSGHIVGLVSAGILQKSLGRSLACTVDPDRGTDRRRALHFVRRRLGDPAPTAAPNAWAAPRRAAGDVRASRRDPAFGVRGADRARS